MDNEITVWLNKVECHPDAAMEKIWQAYYERLVSFARLKLKDHPRRSVDEEDVAAQAFNSLYNGIKANRFPKLNDRHDLWKLLLTIAARKASYAIRNNMAKKRGGGNVRGESIFLAKESAGLQDIAIAPTQEFANQFTYDLFEQLNILDDETLKQVAMLKLEGHSNREIAEKLDVVTRTIDRKLERIRAIWNSGSKE